VPLWPQLSPNATRAPGFLFGTNDRRLAKPIGHCFCFDWRPGDGGVLYAVGEGPAGQMVWRATVAMLAAELAVEVGRTVVVEHSLGVDTIANGRGAGAEP
jgi:hypothetical protein